MPAAGAHGLRVISPTILELSLFTKKDPDPARPPQWDFIRDGFQASLPGAHQFIVTVNGQTVAIKSVGFRRRAHSAPLKKRDLLVGNFLYLELISPVAEGQKVEVKNPDGKLWQGAMDFSTVAEPLRYSPAIHVNQVGYMPEYPKKAQVGYYLGTLGELKVPAQNGFQIVEDGTGKVVFQGPLVARKDVGYTYSPTPYQAVFEADFSALKTRGKFRLQVPGLGASFPFLIDDGVAAAFTRTYALGLYHQRCGTSNELPFTRCPHAACHTAMADVPTMAFAKTQEFIAGVSSDFARNPRHTAPQLRDINASRYPFVRQGKIDVSGGHHDAGDYSKYTINSAALIHHLVFAADAFPGAGELDNLGLPESGDGKSDLLQSAKWEADFLAKMQDTDGGFYFLVYPKDRKYEDNVLPDKGDPQVVWPKTTAVTAAAVAALAEIGSSPLFKKQFPAEAALYMQKATLGWEFLEKAIAKFGKDGSYQKLTHYGNEFMHDDELAWAAAAMFAATGNQAYFQRLKSWFDPASSSTRRWSWWRLYEGFGCAVRTYAFAARTGRVPANQLDAAYLAKCEAEIVAAGQDHVRFAKDNAYGTSFPDQTKQHRSAGWYFSSERAFDITVAYQITPRTDFLEAIISNLNYEAGSNPINMTYITGIGYRRQQDIVHHYAQNDRRLLPPSGIPLGNIQSGFQHTWMYKSELNSLSFPSDGAATAPYPFYDRWGDTFNVSTEFVIVDQARSLGSLSFLMAQSPLKEQSWRAGTATITGLPNESPAEQPVTATLEVPGLDLTDAQIVWEARDQQPNHGPTFTFTPRNVGTQWVEAEAMLPDGRRVFAVTSFSATTSLNVPSNPFQSAPVPLTSNLAALYRLDGNLADATGKNGILTLHGNASLDGSNLGWMAERTGGAIRFNDLGDKATVSLPSKTVFSGAPSAVVRFEAMIYVNEFKAYNRSPATLLSLKESWNAHLSLTEDPYQGARVQGGTQWDFSGAALKNVLAPQRWHHISFLLDRTGYTLRLDGKVVSQKASAELGNWGRSASVTLEMGNFDGWIDEVAVFTSATSTGTDPIDVPPINQPPQVSLVNPVSGAVIHAPGSITLSAQATDDGGISKVEFFELTRKIGEATAAPYRMNWDVAAGGFYTFTAKATDHQGLSTTSAPVTVFVQASAAAVAAPAISPNGGNFGAPVAVTLSSSTSGATIRYTTDGSQPTASSPVYMAPLTLTSSAMVQARAYKSGMDESAVTSAGFTITANSANAPQVKFVRTDVSTRGNWKGVYGGDGYNVIGHSVSYPSYAQVQASGHGNYIWTQITSDNRALQQADGLVHRFAGCWYSVNQFSVDLNIAGSELRRVALYFVDWDKSGREQTVEVMDTATGALLNVQNLSAFSGGQYLVWDIKGKVTIRLTRQEGINAVLSGIFFGSSQGSESNGAVAFLGADTATRGNWRGNYGLDGFHVIGSGANYPIYAPVAPNGKTDFIWAGSTSDARALLKTTGTDRVAACWVSPSEFNLDVNFRDNQPHRLRLYFLDWDRAGRVQAIQIIDPATGTVLDSQVVSNFQNGTYLTWELKGRVRVRVAKIFGPNATLSGLFFDPPREQVSSAQQHAAIDRSPEGGVRLRFEGEVGVQYHIEASTDLLNWEVIATQTFATATVLFSDSDAASQPHRFYRLRPVD